MSWRRESVVDAGRMDGAYADESAMEADEVIDEVLQLLTSTDPEDRIEGAGVMCEWVNSAYGDVGAALGAEFVRRAAFPCSPSFGATASSS